MEPRLTFPGDRAFVLVDTFGFPFDMLCDKIREIGWVLDSPGFVKAAKKAGWKQKKVISMMTDGIPAGEIDNGLLGNLIGIAWREVSAK